jgi:hypothetical protein
MRRRRKEDENNNIRGKEEEEKVVPLTFGTRFIILLLPYLTAGRLLLGSYWVGNSVCFWQAEMKFGHASFI